MFDYFHNLPYIVNQGTRENQVGLFLWSKITLDCFCNLPNMINQGIWGNHVELFLWSFLLALLVGWGWLLAWSKNGIGNFNT